MHGKLLNKFQLFDYCVEVLLSPNIRAPPTSTYIAATTLLSAHPKCDAGASLQDVLMGLLHSGVIRPLSGVIGQN